MDSEDGRRSQLMDFGLTVNGRRPNPRATSVWLGVVKQILEAVDVLATAGKQIPTPALVAQLRPLYGELVVQADVLRTTRLQQKTTLKELKAERVRVDNFLPRLRGHVKALAVGDATWERDTMRALGFTYRSRRSRLTSEEIKAGTGGS